MGRLSGAARLFDGINNYETTNAELHFCVPRSLDICSYCLMLMDFVHRMLDNPRIRPCQSRRAEINLGVFIHDWFINLFIFFSKEWSGRSPLPIIFHYFFLAQQQNFFVFVNPEEAIGNLVSQMPPAGR